MIRISIYRSDYNSSCNVFEKVKELTIVNVEGPSEPSVSAPAALLVPGNLRLSAKIVPAYQLADGSYIELPYQTMMGGSYGASSDSRFNEAVRKLAGSTFYGAVAIHDRIEN